MRKPAPSRSRPVVPSSQMRSEFLNAMTNRCSAKATILSNLYDAEGIPDAARSEIDALLASGDLFRYRANSDSTVAKLEQGVRGIHGDAFCAGCEFLLVGPVLVAEGAGYSSGRQGAGAGVHVCRGAVRCRSRRGGPVLVEVGGDYSDNLSDFAAKLSAGAKAVIVSHMRGHTSDMDAIMDLCDGRNVPVVEDAAHSLGALWSGQKSEQSAKSDASRSNPTS